MHTIRIPEYKSLTCRRLPRPVSRLLRDRFSRYIDITPNFEGPGFDIQAKDWVGQIVTADFCIVVEPKTPVENLFFMLTYAFQLPVFRSQPFPFGLSDDLLEVLVLIFAKQMEHLVRRGIYRGYVAWEENIPVLRGRLVMRDHLRQNPVRLHRFYTRRDEFTADVLENHLLKAVIFQLSRLEYRNPDLRRRLRRVLRAFDEVSLRAVTRDDFGRVLYGRLNQHYQPVHNLARLLWEHLSVESREGDHSHISYLLHMWQVFEVFVAAFLSEYFTAFPGIDVSEQQNIWLDMDQRIEGRPDIVIKVDNLPALVLETKYKLYQSKPSNADLNQMVMYCHRLGLRKGILVFPGNVKPDRFLFKDITIEVRSLELAGDLPSFRDNCHRFASDLHEIVERARKEPNAMLVE